MGSKSAKAMSGAKPAASGKTRKSGGKMRP